MNVCLQGSTIQRWRMKYKEAATYIKSLIGSWDWVRFPMGIRATPLTLTEGKEQITNAKEFVWTLTLTRVQQEQQATDDTELMSRERAWWLAYWQRLEGSKEQCKPRSVYVTPEASPARNLHPDKGSVTSVVRHLGLELLEGSIALGSSSDSDPQTDSSYNSDTSHWMMTSNKMGWPK